MKKIKFGTGGFRAVIGEEFTRANVVKICQAMSNIINEKNYKKNICIGFDNRFMSEQCAVWCSEVFAGNGIKVHLFDCATSTPVAMYATKINNNDFGIMITASHNPYEYNGIKVFALEGRDASVEQTQEIEREIDKLSIIKRMAFDKALGKMIIKKNYIVDYLINILNLFDLTEQGGGLKVVFDNKFGSTAKAIQMLSDKIGCEYKIINENRDAFFGFIPPAPTPENISDLRAEVLKTRAHIGFSLDADGDRLAVIDEKGNYIDNNYILAVAYYFFVKYYGKKGGSVKNIATSNLLTVLTEKMGYKCYEVPVGFKYVSSALIENQAVVGGESSGGLAIHGHIWGKDSLLAIAICLKAMIVMKKTFSEILKEVKEFVGGYEKVICDKQYSYNSAQKELIDKILFQNKQTPQHRYKVSDVVYCDYIKVYYANGNWSLIRFSGTEPILRIVAEADSGEECQMIIKDWEELLKL
ncbi:MAG: phosphoglucomutase/phosphomannomutase family protein [Clostridiales bacterium]|nr:phosphoglucomutase/phosphomannomutase family protein [Clostridiales bacterium]